MKYQFLFIALLPILLFGQNPIYQAIQKEKVSNFQAMQLFEQPSSSDAIVNERLPDLSAGVLLSLQENTIATILSQPAQGLRWTLPFPGGNNREIILIPARSLSRDFAIRASSGEDDQLINPSGHQYWGIIEGEPESAVAISVYEDQIMGTILTGSETYLLGVLDNDEDQLHVLYNERDLNATNPSRCAVEEIVEEAVPTIDKSLLDANPERCVLMYVEADHDVFLDKGSVAGASNYIMGLFNQVSLMYFNESIKLRLNEVFVWDTADPYTSSSTSGKLNQFGDQVGTSFNGDLAHLVGYEGGGGIAWLNVLCSNSVPHGYSGVNSSYNDIPVYSWSINVLTHEIGHNLGSQHTHACAWNGNNTPIDRCGIDAGYGNGGSCENGATLPSGGGTVMSYCHLVGGVGVDFNLGFGPQPGDYIRDKVYNASCLVQCEPSPEVCDDDFDNDFDGLVDCEDPDCDQYVSCLPCEDNIITLTLVLDANPNQTTWTLTDMAGMLIENSGYYGPEDGGTVITKEFCLKDDCYDFTIFDTGNDGICCNFGEGSYTLSTAAGQVLASSGQYSSGHTIMICDGRVPEICYDGIDNDNDGLTDCEDPDCSEHEICQPCEDNTIIVEVNYDNRPWETSWAFKDMDGNVVLSTEPNDNISIRSFRSYYYCLENGCYTFHMYDTGQDGLCCGNSQGGYQVLNTLGEVLASGATFGEEEETSFCIEGIGCPTGNVYTVTSNTSSGPGSLRQAIYCCNGRDNLDTIIFNLPQDTLFLNESLPDITDAGISVMGMEDLVIFHSGSGPLFTVNASYVSFINLQLMAPEDLSNNSSAIQTKERSTSFLVDGCKIDNFDYGIHLMGTNSLIQNNTFFIPDFGRGVFVDLTGRQSLFRNNVVTSPMSGYGFYLRGDTVEVSNNELYNLNVGVFSSKSNNVDIVGNTIHHNSWAIWVGSGTTAGQQHRISKNSIYCNTSEQGINFTPMANGDHPIPEITEIAENTIIGTATPGDVVEVFIHDNEDCPDTQCQGKTYLGSALTNPDGDWMLNNITQEYGVDITANATDENNNSSLFTACSLYALPCVEATMTMNFVDEVICPGDSALLFIESDLLLDQVLSVGYTMNNGAVILLDNYQVGDTVAIEITENTIFQLIEVADNFDCSMGINSELISISLAETGNLSSTLNEMLCLGDTLFLQNDVVTEVGEFTELYASTLSGCDSIVTIIVEQLPTPHTTENLQICEGAEIEIFGEMISEAGTYQESYSSSFDCDSIHTVHLEVLPNSMTTENVELCNGQSILLFGEEVTTAGVYTGSFTAANQCDSTHQVTVELVEAIHTFGSVPLCPGQTILVFEEPVSEAGEYEATFMAGSGCDSIHQITVFLLDNVESSADESICEGQSIMLFGELVTEAGEYAATFTSVNGCDSTHTVTLTLNEPIQTSEELQTCIGQGVMIFGEFITEAGEYSATFTAVNSCDSTHTIILDVAPVIETFATLQTCVGQTVTIFGEDYTMNAIAMASFTTEAGCDSVHQVTIVFEDQIMTGESQTICTGDEIEIFGEIVTEAGLYSENYTITTGCDSTHTVELFVLETMNTFEEITICEGDEVLIFDETQSEAGVYTEQFVAQNQCDSFHQVMLIVLESSESFNTVTICEGDTAEIFGELVSNPGLYSETYTAVNECDSIATIELVFWDNLQVELTTMPTCIGEQTGEIELVELLGNMPFDYQWGHTDENTAILNELEEGNYELTITDANECSTLMTINIEALSPPDYTLEFHSGSCEGTESGSIIITTEDPDVEVSFQGGAFSTITVFDGLSEGDYHLEIRNGAGCQSSEDIELEASVGFAIEEVAIMEPSCAGDEDGSIHIMMEGGNGNINFNWNTSQTGANLDNLDIGTYQVTITGAGTECELFETIVLEGLAPIEANLNLQLGCGDGQVIALANPEFGQAPYELEWSNSQTGTIASGLTAGDYALSITDNNDCTIVEEFNIPFVAPFDVTYSVEDASCAGWNDGAIHLNIVGGIPPYDIDWETGASSLNLEGLGFGGYLFNVTSASCSIAEEVQVNAPSAISNTLIFDAFGVNQLQAAAFTEGGTAPYNYQWSTGQITQTITGLEQGQEIGLTITDVNGCLFEAVYTAVITDLTDLTEEDLFRVFPNPTSNDLIIESIAGFGLDYDLQLFNTAGALVLKQAKQQQGRLVLSLQGLPSGVYLLVIKTDEYSQVKRVVKL